MESPGAKPRDFYISEQTRYPVPGIDLFDIHFFICSSFFL